MSEVDSDIVSKHSEGDTFTWTYMTKDATIKGTF